MGPSGVSRSQRCPRWAPSHSSVTGQTFLLVDAALPTLECLLRRVILCISPSVSPVMGAAVRLMFSPLLRILQELVLVSFSVWLAVLFVRVERQLSSSVRVKWKTRSLHLFDLQFPFRTCLDASCNMNRHRWNGLAKSFFSKMKFFPNKELSC